MHDPPLSQEEAGLGSALRHLVGDLFAAASQRLELGALELHVAIRRGILGIALVLGASVMAVLALLFLTLGLVWAFGRDHMVVALLITGGAYCALAIVALLMARAIARKKPIPFKSLAMVLKEDSEWILGKKFQ